MPLLPDLALWYEVLLVQGTDPEAALALFLALPSIERASGAPLENELPVTPDYTVPGDPAHAYQGYLYAAPDGVDAQHAWTISGGTGAGVTIYDLENGWLQDHEDLSKARNVQLLVNPGDSAVISQVDHGTEVLGEMIADNDGKGVTGIAYGAEIKLVPTYITNLLLNRPNAILLAVADGLPGDVILLEQQMAVCGSGLYGPIEDELAVFQAIQYATALGFVVIEPAGNGSVDLDDNSDADGTPPTVITISTSTLAIRALSWSGRDSHPPAVTTGSAKASPHLAAGWMCRPGAAGW